MMSSDVESSISSFINDRKVEHSNTVDSGYNSNVFTSPDPFKTPSSDIQTQGADSINISDDQTPTFFKPKPVRNRMVFQRCNSEPFYSKSINYGSNICLNLVPLLSSTPKNDTTVSVPSKHGLGDLFQGKIINSLHDDSSINTDIFKKLKLSNFGRCKSESKVGENLGLTTKKKCTSTEALHTLAKETATKTSSLKAYKIGHKNKFDFKQIGEDSETISPTMESSKKKLCTGISSKLKSTVLKKDPFNDLKKIDCFARHKKVNADEITITTYVRPTNAFKGILDYASYLLPKLCKYLSAKDLFSLSLVNRKLRNAILNTNSLSKKRLNFVENAKAIQLKLGKENPSSKKLNVQNPSTVILSPRKHLQSIQNIHPAPSVSKIQPITLFDTFVKEGLKLRPGQYQLKCVKCENPATIFSDEHRAKCTLPSCLFDYCTRCFLAYHAKEEDCPSLKPRLKSTGSLSGIFSKSSKKRLRRL